MKPPGHPGVGSIPRRTENSVVIGVPMQYSRPFSLAAIVHWKTDRGEARRRDSLRGSDDRVRPTSGIE